MVDISVIVPAKDAATTLPRTLEALARQELEAEYEVIVVDDGSADQTAELAAAGSAQVIRQAVSGPAEARNRGAAAAAGSVLAFCDADVFPTPHWLAAGLEGLQKADLLQGRVLPDPAARLGPFDRSIWVTTAHGLFETANLFVRRETFDRAGGFEDWLTPRIGKALAEDVWFGYRVVRAGARVAYSERALAYHAVFPGTWRDRLLERRRLEYFPAMARKMPELRQRFLYRRVFLNRRTAFLDLGLVGTAAAAVLGSPLLLASWAPYLKELRTHAARGHGIGPPTLAVAAADLASDLVGLAALIQGSVNSRTPVF